MPTATRTFEDSPAVRSRVPLLLGIVGPSSSGKTYSALRLAAGMQRVLKGETFFIDTEGGRGLHYADRFKFRHVPFEPPFGPLEYLAAFEHCVSRGASLVIADSMTHEHSGPGGVMDQAERFLDEKCGTDWEKRQRWQMLAWAKPKQQRKALNAALVRLGINAIFCYRAHEKIKPVAGKEPEKLGWQPETTSPLHYEMTQRFLLTPGCDGVPSLTPETDAERRMVKNPAQFRQLFKAGQPLSEDVGQQLAEWAAGGAPDPAAELFAAYERCATADGWKVLETRRASLWPNLTGTDQRSLKAASDAAKVRVVEQPEPAAATGEPDPSTAEPVELFDNSGDAEMPD